MAKTQAFDGNDLPPAKPRTQNATRQRGVTPSSDLVLMQFKMTQDFGKAFQIQAATHGMNLKATK